MVTSSWRLRWQATRLVRKRLSFHVPFWPLFSWLRRLSIDRLKDPYVDSTDFLARDLEHVLIQHPRWASDSSTRSRALSVVQEVYLAFSAIGKNEPKIAAQLESLQGEFRAEVLDRLKNVEEPATRLSRADWATLQERAVRLRRDSRLQAFRVSVVQMEPYLEGLRTTAPVLPPGSFYLLEGSYGSGKSEQAATWLLQQIERYRLHVGMPVPLHLDARVVEQTGIEERLLADVGLTALRGQGVALVVDGLDEIRSERAARVLEDANTLVVKYAVSKVLLTSRSGVLDGHLLLDGTNHHEQAPLELDVALSLIASVAGTRPRAAMENPGYRESVKLPFFALAAAVAEREGDALSGRAGLIRGLAETAIGRPGVVRTSIGTADVAERLGRLAVSDTRREISDGLSKLERLNLLETGLVRRSDNEARLQFTLPLLEQWFAGQRLLSDPELIDEAVSSSASFEAWRWAVAIALEESHWSQYHAIITRCLERDLGAAAWLIRESSKSKFNTGGLQGTLDLQAERLNDVLEYVMRTAPLYRELVFPLPVQGEQLTFNVRATRAMVGIDWCSTIGDAAPSQQDSATEQPSFSIESWGVGPSAEVTWPWEYIRGRLTKGVDSRFWQHLDLGYSGGLWERERRYALAAKFLEPKRGPAPQRVSLERLRRRLEEILQYVDLDHLGSYKNGRLRVSGAAFRDLVNWAWNCPHAEVGPLVPHPMVDPNTVNFADGLFPRELVDKHLLESHGFGAEMYDEALAGLFSAFKWRWSEPDGAVRGVIGVTEHSPVQRTGSHVMKIAVPAHLLDDIESEYGAAFEISSNGRARFRPSSGDRGESLRKATFAVLDRERYGENGGPPPIWSSSVLRTSNDRPASLVAQDWIRQGLSAVGLDRALTHPRRMYS